MFKNDGPKEDLKSVFVLTNEELSIIELCHLISKNKQINFCTFPYKHIFVMFETIPRRHFCNVP